MKIIRDFDLCPKRCKHSVVALGNFDGLHLGHQMILKRTLETARNLKTTSAVMTFEPHPREFFSRGGERLRIYDFKRKAELIGQTGIDTLFLVRFNQAFASKTPDEFMSLLGRDLAVKHIITGYNFAFGKGREGNTDFIAQKAQKSGFGFTACPPVFDEEERPVSSSLIRKCLAVGDMASAARLLGRRYSIGGRVIHGEKRGRELGFPTANIAISHLFKPRFGIYAVRLKIGETLLDAVASIGIKPSFGAYEPLLEVHVFDMEQDIYGEYATVEFVKFIRDEKRFDDIAALKTEMAKDCILARDILAEDM